MKKEHIVYTNDSCTGLRHVNKEYYLNNLAMFGPGVKLKMTVEHYHPQRSLKQNGVLHWYCTELAEEANMEHEKFKELMKFKFLKRPVLNKLGEEIVDESTGEVEWYVPSTTELNTGEMAKFIDEIRLWGIEFLNYTLPLPDENHRINFQEKHKLNLKNDGIKN